MPKYRKNASNKYDCPEPGCNRTGANGFTSPQGLGQHRLTAHGTPGASSTALAKRQSRSITSRGHEQDNTHTHARVHVSQPTPPIHDNLHYCPGCGYDIESAKMHLHPSVRSMAYIRCPQCKVNLAIVSAALHPELQAIDPEKALVLLEVVRRIAPER